MRKNVLNLSILAVFSLQLIANTTISPNLNEDSIASKGIERSNSVTVLGGELTIFDNRADFLTNCPETELTFEDFGGGPDSVTACGSSISAAGDSCYPKGEIQDGVEITNSIQSSDGPMIFFPAGSFGVEDNGVGADQFSAFTILNFTGATPITAVGFDLYSPLGDGGPIEVRVFGSQGLIEAITFNVTDVAFFVGIVAQEPIVSIELENPEGVIVELVTQLLFGTCEVLNIGGQEFIDFSVFPNPTKNILNLSNSSLIESYSLYDINGKKIVEQTINETASSLDISYLEQGIYYLKVTIEGQHKTLKVIKE